ncbi:hypothetical protein H4R21_006772, partial [Coemansia helicoidea]
ELYRARFVAALVAGDPDAMCAGARVLACVREGRGCIGILADAHPLFGGPGADARCAQLWQAAESVQDTGAFGAFLGGVRELFEGHVRIVQRALPPGWMRVSAAYCFVEKAFAAQGVGRVAVQQACRAQPSDDVYLSTVSGVVGQLLAAADGWERLAAVPQAHGRRCVFGALAGVMGEYVGREVRAIERRYDADVEQWAAKEGAALHAAPEPREARRVNFEQQRQQMDDYRTRVLSVLDAKLGADAGSDTRRTVVGDVVHAPIGVDLCLNMLLANRDAVARLAVVATAAPDPQLRALACDAIERVFCALLKSAGNHVRPAFVRAVAELKELEHAAVERQRAAAAGDSAQRYAGVWQRFFEA